MTLPIATVVRPTVLTGQSNGRLSPEVLVPHKTGQLLHVVARAARALEAAALAAGIELKPTSAADLYRSFERQERVLRARYTTSFDAAVNKGQRHRDNRMWGGQRWFIRKGVAPVASPGTSNHGWGLAIDYGEELDGDAAAESLRPSTLQWLLANAARFGFSWELQSEPWHLRYVAGDNVPAAVLEFENGAAPAPVSVSRPVLRVNSRGADVVFLQRALNATTGTKLTTDGRFGRITEGAVRNLQKFFGHPATGVVEQTTWELVDWLIAHKGVSV